MEEEKTPVTEEPSFVEETKAPAKKNKVRTTVLTVIEIVCLAVFVIAAGYIVKYLVDAAAEDQTDKGIEEIVNSTADEYEDIIVVDPVVKSDAEEQEPEEISTTKKTKGKTLVVRDDETLATLSYLVGKNIEGARSQYKNDDICGWLELTGYVDNQYFIKTIKQLVTQCDDNFFYLDHDATLAEKTSGAVYIDKNSDPYHIMRNDNLIFYAHAMSYNKFGVLKCLDECEEWYNDPAKQFIFFQTEKETSVWRIFSWCETDEDAPYRRTSFSNDAEYVEYLNWLQDRNTIPTLKKYEFTPNDVLLTLSTCKGSNERNRVAVHAVLVAYSRLRDLKK